MGEPRRARPAVAAGVCAAQWWDLAVQAVLAAPLESVEHADLHDLAVELVGTLGSLEDLTAAIALHVLAYRERGEQQRDLRDDEGADPAARLRAAAQAAVATSEALAVAVGPANEFWSAIGHIARDPGPEDAPEHDPEHDREHRDEQEEQP